MRYVGGFAHFVICFAILDRSLRPTDTHAREVNVVAQNQSTTAVHDKPRRAEIAHFFEVLKKGGSARMSVDDGGKNPPRPQRARRENQKIAVAA
jgi:hypothetical protein